jgi:phosphoadenosine phosphosulfate reductase
MPKDIAQLNKKFASLNLKEAFEALDSEQFKNTAFSTSFGMEDQVITHHILSNKLPITVFTLDTGRLFEETYEVFNRTKKNMVLLF